MIYTPIPSNQATEITCDNDQVSDLIGKDFKGATVDMSKEVDKIMKRSKKQIYDNVTSTKNITRENILKRAKQKFWN